MLCTINCQNVVIKYNTRVWWEYLQQKYQNKKYKIANIKIFYYYYFLSFLYIKGLDIKMSLISAEGYKNAKVSHLKIKETGELWVSIKDVGDGLGVKTYLT